MHLHVIPLMMTDNQKSQHAPRMLRLELTDGVSKFSAVEVSHHAGIDQDRLRPGMKIFFPTATPILSGFICLSDKAKLLGGHVRSLVEAWELQKSLSEHRRTGGGDEQPPPFVPFSVV
jgi:hypothetical protein